jgi:glycosyltransferase involved in cell wall biosynthesis
MKRPVVSICTITFGHEQYISDTIEGVLMQETDFPIEFIIADDCSLDNTENVVKSIIENHPKGHWIRYTKHAVNKGMNPNFVWALKQCQGKYIALCEGDDYWTDSKKLQKQVNFLEKNEEYVICAHNSIRLKKTMEMPRSNDLPDGDFISVLIDGVKQDTLSVIFRNQIDKIPDWFYQCPNGDLPLFLLLLGKGGKLKYLNDVMGVYRHHDGGVWSSLEKRKKGENGIITYELFDKGFNFKYHKYVKKAITKRKLKFGLYTYKIGEVFKGDLPLKNFLAYYINLIKSKVKKLMFQ